MRRAIINKIVNFSKKAHLKIYLITQIKSFVGYLSVSIAPHYVLNYTLDIQIRRTNNPINLLILQISNDNFISNFYRIFHHYLSPLNILIFNFKKSIKAYFLKMCVIFKLMLFFLNQTLLINR